MYIQSHMKGVLCAVILCASVCGVFSISGCIKTDTETLAKIEALQTQIDHVEGLLQQAHDQRQTLLQRQEMMTDLLMAAQSQIQELIESGQFVDAVDAVDDKLSRIGTEQHEAGSEIKKIHTQIRQFNDRVDRQTQAVTDLKLLVDDLKYQLADLQETMAPAPPDEPVALTEAEQPQPPDAMVGFPAPADSSVVIIRGPSRD